jgi:NAD(P)-dependent dehydrogenase (short-subunit alcohol dehydrogenase family)
MNINFANQNALVTGGTRGIGKQVAEDLANLGAHVIITGTKEPKEKVHQNIQFVSANFLDDASTENFLNMISKESFDVCVNNAGINRIDPFCDVKLEDWNDIIKVNLTAPFRVQQAVCPSMVRRKYGRVVNIASVWSEISTPKRASYSSSKFGIRGLTLASAAELAQHNVLINAVSPGFTLTDLTRDVLGPERMQEISEMIPMRRMAEVDEISRVILFVSSRWNSYISGQNIIADGGFVNI